MGIGVAQAQPLYCGQYADMSRYVTTALSTDLPLNTRVRFEATPVMNIGQTGITLGTVIGYLLRNPTVTCPDVVNIQRSEWGTIQYMVRFDRQPGNNSLVGAIGLYRSQFEVIP